MKNDKPILVFGATGQQGGSTARALIEAGWQVRALLRDPTSSRARSLAAAGIELVPGDMRDKRSIRDATKGAYGVFSVQPSSGQPEHGVTDEDEIRFGIAVADAAAEADVKHLVYSSVAGAGPHPGIGHYASKWRVEEHIRGLSVVSTILRPAAFMELLLLPMFGLAQDELTFFVEPDQPMQLIAVEDIGQIAAKVFANPEMFKGKTFDIASDTVTGTEVAAKISDVLGRRISYRKFPASVLQDIPLLRRLVELVEQGPAAGSADLPALRKLVPDLRTFDQWFATTGRTLLTSAASHRAEN